MDPHPAVTVTFREPHMSQHIRHPSRVRDLSAGASAIAAFGFGAYNAALMSALPQEVQPTSFMARFVMLAVDPQLILTLVLILLLGSARQTYTVCTDEQLMRYGSRVKASMYTICVWSPLHTMKILTITGTVSVLMSLGVTLASGRIEIGFSDQIFGTSASAILALGAVQLLIFQLGATALIMLVAVSSRELSPTRSGLVNSPTLSVAAAVLIWVLIRITALFDGIFPARLSPARALNAFHVHNTWDASFRDLGVAILCIVAVLLTIFWLDRPLFRPSLPSHQRVAYLFSGIVIFSLLRFEHQTADSIRELFAGYSGAAAHALMELALTLGCIIPAWVRVRDANATGWSEQLALRAGNSTLVLLRKLSVESSHVLAFWATIAVSGYVGFAVVDAVAPMYQEHGTDAATYTFWGHVVLGGTLQTLVYLTMMIAVIGERDGLWSGVILISALAIFPFPGMRPYWLPLHAAFPDPRSDSGAFGTELVTLSIWLALFAGGLIVLWLLRDGMIRAKLARPLTFIHNSQEKEK